MTDEELSVLRKTAMARAYDEIETSKSMSEYYAEKAKYYNEVYQEVLNQLGEETMANANAYMVSTWEGHDEFKKKYFDKLAKEAAEKEKRQALEDEYATQEEANDAAERAKMAKEARAAVLAYAKEHGYDKKIMIAFLLKK